MSRAYASTPVEYQWMFLIFSLVSLALAVAGCIQPEDIDNPGASTGFTEFSDALSITPTTPQTRAFHSAVWDTNTGTMLVFGGDYSSVYPNEIWRLRWEGSSWNWMALYVMGTPPDGRSMHAAVWIPERNRMIMFGGYDGSRLDETWQLTINGSTAYWTELTPSGTSPGAMYTHSAVWDPINSQVIIFGGRNPTGYTNDTWALRYDGTAWSWNKLTPSGTLPSARYHHTAVWNNAKECMMVFGGYDLDSNALNDTWALTWDGTSWEWSEMKPAGTAPQPRGRATAIWDPANSRMVVFGGYDNPTAYNDTWSLSWNGKYWAWIQITPDGVAPPVRWAHSAVWDPINSRMFVFGGRDVDYIKNDTWILSWDDQTWSWAELAPPATPLGRSGHSAVWYMGKNSLVVFGGYDGSHRYNDVWAITKDIPFYTRNQLSPEGTPPSARDRHTSVYDLAGGSMVVFGGQDESGPLNDAWYLTWSYYSCSWRQLQPSGTAPSKRVDHSAVWDPAKNRMIVFGGYDGANPLSDVWTLTRLSSTWTWAQLSPSGTAPSARANHSAVWDEANNRMIIFGGYDGTSLLNDVWTLTLSGTTWTWAKLSPSGTAPTPRTGHVAGWDAANNQMVVSGGSSGCAPLDDSWTLKLVGSTWTWSKLSPLGTAPSARHEHSAGWDSGNSRFVIYGGYDGDYKDDYYRLTLSGTTWAWSKASPDEDAPDVTNYNPAVWDDAGNRMILLLGAGAAGSWILNSERSSWSWTEFIADGTKPSGRWGHSAVLRQADSQIVVFGGRIYYDPANDLWTLNWNGLYWFWNQVAPSGTPPPARYCHSAVVGGPEGQMIVFGGYDGSNVFDDTWVLSPDGASWSWSQLNPSGTPPPARDRHSAVWDEAGNQMILFGGAGDSSVFNDTWALRWTGSNWIWVKLVTSGTPPSGRHSHAAVWDAANNRMIVFGGEVALTTYNDVWALTRNGSSWSWSQVTASGTPPQTSESPSAVWDTRHSRMIIFGGFSWDGGGMLDDTSTLTWDGTQWSWNVEYCDDAPPAAAYLQTDAETVVQICHPEMTWQVPGAVPGCEFHVFVNGVDVGTTSSTTFSLPTGVSLDAVNTWQVQTFGCPGSVAVSETASFEFDASAIPTPAAPVLISQPSFSCDADEPRTFSWSDSSGNDVVYDLILNGQRFTTGISTTSLTLPSGTRYQAANTWQVAARNCAHETLSDIGTFDVTSSVVLQTPVITAPAHASTVYCDPQVTWTYPSETTGVLFDIIKLDGTVLADDIECETSPCSRTLADSERLDNGSYNYRVVARNCGGDTAPSGARSFTVDNIPIIPVLLAPYGGQLTSPTPTFTWTTAGQQQGDVRYSLYLDGASTPLISDLTDTSYTVPAQDSFAVGGHSWRIVAYGCRNNQAESEWGDFVVRGPATGAFNLTSPPDQTWFADNLMTVPVEWESAEASVEGLTRYRVVVNGDEYETTTPPNYSVAIAPPYFFESEIYSISFTGSLPSEWTLEPLWESYTASTTNCRSGYYCLRYYNVQTLANRNDSATLTGPANRVLEPGAHLSYYIRLGNVEQLYVEVKYGENDWIAKRVYTAPVTSWTQDSIDLSDGADQQVSVRFRLTNDSDSALEIAYIDDLELGPFASKRWSEGGYVWTVEAIDSVGNISTAEQSWFFGIDTKPPAIFDLLLPADGDSTPDSRPTFSWEPAKDPTSGVEEYRLLIDGNIAAEVPGTTTTAAPVYDLDEGARSWNVVAVDRAGNTRTSSSTRTVNVDLVSPPTVTLLDVTPHGTGEWVASQLPEFRFTATDDINGSGIDHFELFVDGVADLGNPVADGDGCAPDTCRIPFDLILDGAHEWFVIAYDKAGRFTQSDTGRFVVETAPPDAFIHLSPANGATIPSRYPTLCWNRTTDAGSGVKEYRISIEKQGEAETVTIIPGEGATPDVCYTPEAGLYEGEYTWLVSAVDLAGNTTVANNGVRWAMTINPDVAPPSVAISAPVSGMVYGAAVTVRGTANDGVDGSGVTKIDVYDPASPDSVVTADFAPLTGEFSVQMNFDTDGSKTLCARGFDAEGNSNPDSGSDAAPCVTFVTDLTPPLPFDVLSPLGNRLCGARPSFSWQQTTDEPAGVGGYFIQIDEMPEIDAGMATTYNLTEGQSLTDGEYTWTVRAIDSVGNSRQASNHGSFRVDVANPGIVSLLSPLDMSWSNIARPQLCWNQLTGTAATDVASYRVFIDDIPYLVDAAESCFTPADDLFESSHSWKVAFVDNYGNEGPESDTWTIRIDLTPPQIPVQIEPRDNTVINTSHPEFKWELPQDIPADGGSGICGYVVTLNGISQDVEQEVTTLLWGTSVADGTHTWTIAAFDCAGNDGQASGTRTFQIDTVQPSGISFVAPAAGIWLANARPAVQWTSATDEFSGLCGYLLSIDAQEDVVLAKDTVSWTSSEDLPDGLHEVQVLAVDCAGNSGDPESLTFGTDVTPPETIALVSPTNDACTNMGTPEFTWEPCSDKASGCGNAYLFIDNMDAAGAIAPTSSTAFPASTLSEGTHVWAVTCTDKAGNENSSDSRTVNVDQTVPAAEINRILTSGGTLLISGTAGDTGGCGVGSVEVRVDSDGSFAADYDETIGEWSISLGGVSEGGHSVWAKSLDFAGNVSPEYRVDLRTGQCWTSGACNAITGDCSTPDSGKACDDGNACTYPDICDLSGICDGTPRDCIAGPCHASATCDGAGGCNYVLKPQGSDCDDGNRCSSSDRCNAEGICSGILYECPEPGQCQTSVDCDGSGGCIFEYEPENTQCDDHDPCTSGDRCEAGGVCQGILVQECLPDYVEPGPDDIRDVSPTFDSTPESSMEVASGDGTHGEVVETGVPDDDTDERENGGGCAATGPRRPAPTVLIVLLFLCLMVFRRVQRPVKTGKSV